jgi:hypothetical protein
LKPIRDAVEDQDPYDGPRTTTSKYKAGLVTRQELASINPRVVTSTLFKKETPVCGTWLKWRHTAKRESFGPSAKGATASAQALNTDDHTQRVTAIYLNSIMKPKDRDKLFTAGTVLHEALHNFTGLDDDELQAKLDIPTGKASIEITLKLKAVGCVK